MKRSRAIIGRPVINLAEGAYIGRVRDLVIDPAARAVAAIVIQAGALSREQKFVPYNRVQAVGANAIVLGSGDRGVRTPGLPEIVRLWKERTPVVGARVVSVSGSVLGVVREYYVDPATGDLAGFEVAASYRQNLRGGRRFIAVRWVKTLGRDILIVDDAALGDPEKPRGAGDPP